MLYFTSNTKGLKYEEISNLKNWQQLTGNQKSY